MSELDIERLMKGYGESLGTSSRRIVPRSSARPRRTGLVAAAIAIGAVGTVALWPRDATAARLRRVNSAISNARSMEVVSQLQYPSGMWQEFSRVSYLDGMWRRQSYKGIGLQITLIQRGEGTLTSYAGVPHATLTRSGLDESLPVEASALDYAKRGLAAQSAQETIRESAPINGVPTYIVQLDRAHDQYRAEILVDARTDLPIRAEMSVRNERRGDLMHYREEYRFNEPISNDRFEFKIGKPVVVLEEAESALAKRWAKPRQSLGRTELREACVTPDGTVWIVVTAPGGGQLEMLPTRIDGYFRLPDVDPSSRTNRRSKIVLDGERPVLVGFAPVRTVAIQPEALNVVWSSRRLESPGSAGAEGTDAVVRRVPLRRAKGKVPEFLTGLNLDRYGLEIPMLVAQARARTLRSTGDFLEAAEAFREAAEAQRRWVRYSAYRPLQEAAECYARAGRHEEAAECEREANRLLSERER